MVRKLCPIAVAAALAAGAVSCRRTDVRSVLLDVPHMRNAACVELVTSRLRNVPGVKAETIRVDERRRRITVAYDSLFLSRKNIEFEIAEAGFEVNGVPADPGALAALPPECAP
ncbi:MAG: heavy-metal-associated domain-containing protein [Lentisphaerae bacterium]|nr:heavy-metal-associated domain-containing protein [Lentisphaerota bacterium]